MEEKIPFADDDEGFFQNEGEDPREDPMGAPDAVLWGSDDENGEPIGWINGRPANEQQQQRQDPDGDIEMDHLLDDADAQEVEQLLYMQQQQAPELVQTQVVTDGPVKEWIDPVSRYVADTAVPEEGSGTRKRRGGGGGAEQHAFFCYYCKAAIDTEPFKCPHPDTTIQMPIPDLEYPFCHPTCAKGWATWEVGDPLADKLCSLIDARAGYAAEVAPAPYEMLVNQMGGLKVRENFIRDGGGNARRATHKDGKVDQE